MKYEVYTDDAGEWRWRLKAVNGKIIAQGEGYKRKMDCSKAVMLLQRSAEAEIIYLETKDGCSG